MHLQAMVCVIGRIFGCGGDVLGVMEVLEMLESKGQSEWSEYRRPKATML